MKRFTLSGIKASLEDIENKNSISLESEDTESSDAIDEALSKNTASELDDLPNDVEMTETEVSVDAKSPEESAPSLEGLGDVFSKIIKKKLTNKENINEIHKSWEKKFKTMVWITDNIKNGKFPSNVEYDISNAVLPASLAMYFPTESPVKDATAIHSILKKNLESLKKTAVKINDFHKKIDSIDPQSNTLDADITKVVNSNNISDISIVVYDYGVKKIPGDVKYTITEPDIGKLHTLLVNLGNIQKNVLELEDVPQLDLSDPPFRGGDDIWDDVELLRTLGKIGEVSEKFSDEVIELNKTLDGIGFAISQLLFSLIVNKDSISLEDIDEDLDDLESNDAVTEEPVTETETEVPVKTPEESSAEVSNKELALDMEEVGALESLVEVLNSSYGNTSSHVNKLAIANLRLSYGLEQFGFNSDFEIKSERDKNHFVKVISSIVDEAKGYNSLGNEEDSSDKSKISVRVNKLKEKLKALFKAFVEMLKKLGEKFVKFVKSLIDNIATRTNNIKEMIKQGKINRTKVFSYKINPDSVEGSPFDSKGKLRLNNIKSNLNSLLSISKSFVNILVEVNKGIKTEDHSFNDSYLKLEFETINKETSNISNNLNKDFRGLSVLTTAERDLTKDHVSVNVINIERDAVTNLKNVDFTVPEILTAVTGIDAEHRALKSIISEIDNASEVLLKVSSQTLQVFDSPFKLSNIDGGRNIYTMSSFLSSAMGRNINLAHRSIKGIEDFLKSAESFVKANLAEEIEIDEVSSTESFDSKAIESTSVIKDPVVRLEAITYNLDTLKKK